MAHNNSDLIGVTGLGAEFARLSGLAEAYDPARMYRSLTIMLPSKHSVILVNEHEGEIVSALCGSVRQHPFLSMNVAAETFWYSRGGTQLGGFRLMGEFEKWAESKGADVVVMAHMDAYKAERMRDIYERRGFRLLESRYMKELQS